MKPKFTVLWASSISLSALASVMPRISIIVFFGTMARDSIV